MATSQVRICQRTLVSDASTNAYDFFATLPYKARPYCQRNWGHPFHFMCSYQSKLKPSIAHFLVSIFAEPGQTVLDPFSGVGTIPFEACLQGVKGIGLDINPVAYHNTQAKVDPPELDRVLEQVTELQHFMESHPRSESFDQEADDFTRRFYHPDTLTEILEAREFFKGKSHDKEYSLLLSCLLHILHGNRPYALSRRSHGLTPITPTGETVYKSLITKLTEKVSRAYSEPLPSTFVRGIAFEGSAFHIPLDNAAVDRIITSPPFINSTRFFANNRIRLWFCDWDYRKQNGRASEFVEEMQSKDMSIYEGVFKELRRVIRSDGLCILHLGVVEEIDMGETLLPFAESQGFEKTALIYEDASKIESHGMTDQGVTHKHQFLFLKPS